MKKTLTFVLATLALALAISAPAAAETPLLTADIPFSFTAGGKVLPAGEYTVQYAASGAAVIIRAVEHRASLVLMTYRSTDGAAERNDARLTFNRYGDSYFLSQIWDGYAPSANVVFRTRTENELSRTASVQSFEVLAFLARR